MSELKQSLSKCFEEGALSKPTSLQLLRGRLGFCESQSFGRIGNLATKSLVDHAYRVLFKKLMSEQCRRDIVRLMYRLDGKSLGLSVGRRQPPGICSRTFI